MNTKHLIYSCLFLFLTLCSSCSKFLEQQPISDLTKELFWKSAEDAKLANAAIYNGVQRTLNGNYIDWGEARSDNFTYSGTGEFQLTVTLNALEPTMGLVNWDNIYLTIGRANSSIKYLPTITDLSENQKNHYLAQAYAIRAYMYFYAIRLWGDVPLKLEPYEDIGEDPTIERTSASLIMNEVIIPDLKKAEELIDKAIIEPVWEINIGGVLAIMTDVYLWNGNYQEAVATTDKIITLNTYGLAPASDWKKLFTDPGTTSIKENIWSLHWNVSQNGSNGISKIGSGSNTSQYRMDSVAFELFEANKADIRRQYTYDTLLLQTSTGLDKIGKFYALGADGRPIYPNNNANEAKLPLYRYADILLMRAEALNKLNDKQGAFLLINQVRTRAKTTALRMENYPEQEDIERAILNERQLELFGEGKRWFDLVRTKNVIKIMDPIIKKRQRNLLLQETGFSDERLMLFPISREVMNRNPKITQNPPYTG
ncbi:RagB/SusD family nutrient uptake outer membrane protein [Olivibacter domesticus]|uniref:Starch-binding associating with outer membrane n=1 Tax=Olivibacter domesticus TaxID=407022 RepID=A0A1H7QG56_OLID1|nr:RagB/SusD family nutrient uptake outer membrane protein [Olivibacter domesticus]SEL46896.1 Starch-binding associating with outer membrane [Olivibacter domesticus]